MLRLNRLLPIGVRGWVAWWASTQYYRVGVNYRPAELSGDDRSFAARAAWVETLNFVLEKGRLAKAK